MLHPNVAHPVQMGGISSSYRARLCYSDTYILCLCYYDVVQRNIYIVLCKTKCVMRMFCKDACSTLEKVRLVLSFISLYKAA